MSDQGPNSTETPQPSENEWFDEIEKTDPQRSYELWCLREIKNNTNATRKGVVFIAVVIALGLLVAMIDCADSVMSTVP